MSGYVPRTHEKISSLAGTGWLKSMYSGKMSLQQSLNQRSKALSEAANWRLPSIGS